MRKYFWVLGLLCLPTMALAGTLQDLAYKLGKDLKNIDVKIAIMDFSVGETGGKQDSFVVRERISTLLVQNKNITVIERSLLEKVLQEQKLQMSGTVDAARKVGELAGATVILSGTISELANNEIEVNARIIEVGTGKVVSAGQAVLKKDWKFIAPPALVKEEGIAAGSAQDYYRRGVQYHNDGKYNMALEFYSKAIELKPDYLDAYFGRGSVYSLMSSPLNQYVGIKNTYSEAIADYDRVINLKIDYMDAYFYRAMALIEVGDYDRAVLDLTKTIEMTTSTATAIECQGAYIAYPDTPDYLGNYLHRARAFLGKGRVFEANADYEKVLERFPYCASIYDRKGAAYLQKEDYPKAVFNYSRAIELSSNSVSGYYRGRGSAYYANGDYDKAILDYTAAIDLNEKRKVAAKTEKCDDSSYKRGAIVPDACLPNQMYDEASSEYYSGRANAQYMKAEYLKAIADYTRAIELNAAAADDLGPSPAAYMYVNRGNAYRANKETKKALEDYNKAIELDSKSVDAYFNRAQIMYESDEIERAHSDLNKVIELDPKNPGAYFARGSILLWRNENKKAISDFDKLIEINPSNSEAYRMRGEAYYKLYDYDNAINNLSKALGLNPEDAVAFDRRIGCYIVRGDYDKAIADCNAGIKKNPSLRMNRLRANAYFFKGEHGNAIKDLNALITGGYFKANADDAENVYEMLGQAHSAVKDYGNAIKAYTKGLESKPSRPALLHRLRAEAYYASGNHKKSAEDVSKALELSPDMAEKLQPIIDFLEAIGYKFKGLK